MDRVCKHVDCKAEPVAKVSGGMPTRSVNLSTFGSLFWTGWQGDYCTEHVKMCVETQLFQVDQDMPIIIRGLS